MGCIKAGEKDNQLSKSLLAQSQDLFSSENEDAGGIKEKTSEFPPSSFASTSDPLKEQITSSDPTMKAIMNLTAEFEKFKKQGTY